MKEYDDFIEKAVYRILYGDLVLFVIWIPYYFYKNGIPGLPTIQIPWETILPWIYFIGGTAAFMALLYTLGLGVEKAFEVYSNRSEGGSE